MERISKETFAAVLQVAREKWAYEQERAKGWQRPRGLAGVFATRPRDPWPEVGDPRNLLSDTSRLAYADLNGSSPGMKGPEDSKSKFSVSMDVSNGRLLGTYRTECESSNTFHDECLEYRKGSGLIHSYTHDPDPKKDSANRAYACERYMGNRHDNPWFEHQNAALDKARYEFDSLAKMTFDRRTLQRELKTALEAVRRQHEADKRLDGIREQARSEVKISDVPTYAKARLEVESMITATLARPQELTDEKRAEFAGKRSAVRAYAGSKFADQIAYEVQSTRTHQELYQIAEKKFWLGDDGPHAYRDPKLPENVSRVSQIYASLARKDGYQKDEIIQQAKMFCEAHGAEPDLYGLRKAVEHIDEERVKNLHESISERGIQAVTVVMAGYAGEVNRDVKELAQAEKADKLLADMRDAFGMKDQKVVDTAFISRTYDFWEDEGKPVSLEHMAKAMERYIDEPRYRSFLSSLKTVDAQRNVMEIDAKLQSQDRIQDKVYDLYIGSDKTVDMLAVQMCETAVYLKEKEPQKLHDFIRDSGVTSAGKDSDLLKDFRSAAARMYGAGEPNTGKIDVFRKNWDAEMKVAAAPRLEALRSGSKPRVSAKLNKGPKL